MRLAANLVHEELDTIALIYSSTLHHDYPINAKTPATWAKSVASRRLLDTKVVAIVVIGLCKDVTSKADPQAL